MTHPGQIVYVACCPTFMAANWEALGTGLPNPVSVFHTIVQCDRCHQDCWIGPNQKIEATKPNATIVCYRCIMTDEDFLGQAEIPFLSVNPDADEYPRRF